MNTLLLGPLTLDLSLTIAIISLFVSTIAMVAVYRFHKNNLWHGTALEHHKSRLEIDKLFIEYPDLWSIYDKHPVTKQMELSIQQQVRKDALAQYHLHLYKTVYEFYNEHLIKSRQDRKAWKIWVQYIEHDLERSSHIRETVKRSYSLYDKKLVKFYKTIIRRIESKPVNQIDEH